MWKAPHRPRAEISQSYNDGVATVYAVTDAAAPGYQPKETLTKRIVLRYAEQRLGIQRYYSAKQNQTQVERVIRVPRTAKVSSQDVAVTEDGRQYRIDLVQTVQDVYPPSMDLTLVRVTQEYEVST